MSFEESLKTMSETPTHPPSDQDSQNDSEELSAAAPQTENPDRIVDVMDLVYKGGYSRDPQEILGDPAVAPQMLSEGRDLRVDLFSDAEETFSASAPDSVEQDGQESKKTD